MNYVAHLFLADPTDEHRIGSLLADFTVGTLDSLKRKYGEEITVGIAHHRAIDRFTDSHPVVIRAVDALTECFGLYSGIIVDVVFDHFLLIGWHDYTDEPLDVFFDSVYLSLSRTDWEYPDKYKRALSGILQNRWLASYRDLDAVVYALKRIGMRFSKPTPLADTHDGIIQNYAMLQDAFTAFFPELIDFSNSWEHADVSHRQSRT